jgi:uroporphyrinogen-III synthase
MVSEMQQNKVSILSTRPLEDYLLEEVKQAGIDIDIIPFIETVPVSEVAVKQQIAEIVQINATVIFTSMNAVEAVAAQLNGAQPLWNIYAMGTATHRLVEKYFGAAPLAGTAASAAALAEVVSEKNNVTAVFFFCSDLRREELPQILKALSISVTEIIVYKTIAVPSVLSKTYQAILFFSPSAVESFFSINKLADTVLLFAIGNTTAHEIRKYTTNTIIISDEPGKENLVKKLIKYFCK